MSETKLLPCPFCGGEASADGWVRYTKGSGNSWADGTPVNTAFFVNCVSCGISNQGPIGHRTQADAIAKWNRRLATPASAPVGERTDTERLDWLEDHGSEISWLRPNSDPDVVFLEYDMGVSKAGRSLREVVDVAIDTARAAERRDQEEGR